MIYVITAFAILLAVCPVYAKSKKIYMAELKRDAENSWKYEDLDYPFAVPQKIKKYTCYVGYQKLLDLANAKRPKVKWFSSNKKVATVKKGLVKTKKPGKVTIKAKYKGKTYKCKFTVLYAKKSVKASDYLVNGILKSGVKIETEKPSVKSGKYSEYKAGKAKEKDLGYLDNNMMNGHVATYWSAVIDDAIQARVCAGGTLYSYNGKVYLGLERYRSSSIRCMNHTIYGERNVPGFDVLKIVSVSDKRIDASHVLPGTRSSFSDRVYIKEKEYNTVPNGTTFNVVVSYLGKNITVPCLFDKNLSRYKEFKLKGKYLGDAFKPIS